MLRTRWANELAEELPSNTATVKIAKMTEIAHKVSDNMKDFEGTGGFGINTHLANLLRKIKDTAPQIEKLCRWIEEQDKNARLECCPDFWEDVC